MRAVLPILLLLAGCGGADDAREAENVALDPAVLVPKSTATSVAGVDLTQAVRAFGTEPYWTLDIAPRQIRFEDLDIKHGKPVEWAPRPAKIEGITATIATLTPGGEAVTITLRGESCLDVGGEGSALPLKAVVRIGERTLTGCAGQNLATAPDGNVAL